MTRPPARRGAASPHIFAGDDPNEPEDESGPDDPDLDDAPNPYDSVCAEADDGRHDYVDATPSGTVCRLCDEAPSSRLLALRIATIEDRPQQRRPIVRDVHVRLLRALRRAREEHELYERQPLPRLALLLDAARAFGVAISAESEQEAALAERLLVVAHSAEIDAAEEAVLSSAAAAAVAAAQALETELAEVLKLDLGSSVGHARADLARRLREARDVANDILSALRSEAVDRGMRECAAAVFRY